MPAARSPALVALSLAGLLGAVPAAAQDEPSPAPSPEPAVEVVDERDPTEGSWRRLSAAPFGAIDVPGGWTGTELVIADPNGKRRASSYLPALDAWSDVAKPPRKLRAGGQTHWTGTELVFVEPRGTSRRGLPVYDPVADAWRATAASPLNEIASSALAGETLLVASATGARTAAYDLPTDTWTELPALDEAIVVALHSTGEEALALALVGDDQTALARFDREAGAWAEPAIGPLPPDAAPLLWTGDTFVSLSAPGAPAVDEITGAPAEGITLAVVEDAVPPPVSASFEPLSGEWAVVENACDIDTSGAVWAAPLIIDVDRDAAFDPATGACYPVPDSSLADRSAALRVWTGNEVIDVSGGTGGDKPRRDGVAFDPFPGDDPLGVVLDEPSRAVRVQVPSLRIDLPVISDNRKVPGSSPGYPACDVALSWSAFDRPGRPGTAWILAHAQEGMFLPLLETFRAKGKAALLGREVEVQLRDGRVLTYRTYRANPRATTSDIGLKGRKKDEHRLVLQTSTGVGTAPKLLVAARLVDVGTTEEPRPKPAPRACG